jgi:alpha-glucosidase (family GH31 glycosyl hydrolase)
MHEYETFTVDTAKFPLDRLRNITKYYHYIPIVEPSIRYREGYAFNEGKARNVFIKSADGNDQIGKVWAGDVVFTDYFHPNASQYWTDMMQYLYNQVPFSGIWLDMNEISNLCDGPCYVSPDSSKIDFTNDIPYHPGG